MKNKKNKKKNILKIIVILIIFIAFIFFILNIRIKNIYVIGNKILTDQEIIELSGLVNYPKLFSKSIRSIESKIELSPYVEKVNIKKNLFGRVTINVLEYELLVKDEKDNTVYLSNLKNIPLDEVIIGIPTLINEVDSDILSEFLKKLKEVDKNILAKISEISYLPNEYDKDLFLFYMNDGNYVYITTTKLLNINKYDSILEELKGVKGILYLDSGNHFEILR